MWNLSDIGAAIICFLIVVTVFVFGVHILLRNVDQATAITQAKVVELEVRRVISQKDTGIEDTSPSKILPKLRDDGKLVIKKGGNLVDIWGRPIRVETEVAHESIMYKVKCRGYDGIWGTSDDIALGGNIDLSARADDSRSRQTDEAGGPPDGLGLEEAAPAVSEPRSPQNAQKRNK